MNPSQFSKPEQNLSDNQDFVTKPIEQPILDPSLREKISTAQETAPGDKGIKAFYKANKIYVWAIAVGLIIIGVLAFIALRPRPKPVPKEANVKVDIQVPENIAAGSEAVYQIKVENQDSQSLVNLQLELVYPSGMTYISSSPKADNLSGSLFTVPNLISGQNATIFVKARATGNVNDNKQLLARLHYKYSNFNSEFIKEGAANVRLTASDVLLELSGPESANSAQLLVYTVKYKNNSDQEIKNARIQLDYPEGFVFSTATPLPDLGSNIWNVSSLPSKTEGSLVVSGSYKSVSAGEAKTTTAKFLVLGQDGGYYVQNSSDFSTNISSLPLIATQSFSGKSGADIANPGETLQFNVGYQNNSNIVASGVSIIVSLTSKCLDLSTLRAEGGVISGNTILWNASTVAALENLAPSESGSLGFSVKVNDPAVKDSSKNLDITSSIKIKANEYETYFPGDELDLKVASPAGVSSSLEYASGSLPPQVGKDTFYSVQISLNNSTNDFSDAHLAAFLPLGPAGFVVGSVAASEAQNVQFDSSTGKLTWDVGTLPAHSGQFIQPKTLQFKVKLNPASSQVDQSPNLITGIQFSAKDSYTNQQVELKGDDITTADLTGKDGYINGRVAP